MDKIISRRYLDLNIFTDEYDKRDGTGITHYMQKHAQASLGILQVLIAPMRSLKTYKKFVETEKFTTEECLELIVSYLF